jgi:hypothetical protein
MELDKPDMIFQEGSSLSGRFLVFKVRVSGFQKP